MMGSSQSNRSGSDANKSSFHIEFHPVLSGTNTNTQITVIIVNSSHGSSFCQQSIMKETAHGESNRTDGSVVCQAAGCGCALTEASPESSQSNHSGSDANESSFQFHPVLSGTNTNTQITVVMVNSSHGSSFCQQSIMKETAQGESNRTDGGAVCQAAGCGCALTEASPELGQAVVSSHMKLLNWNTPIRLVKVAPLLTSLGHETLLNWKTSILDRASKNCTTFMASLRAS